MLIEAYLILHEKNISNNIDIPPKQSFFLKDLLLVDRNVSITESKPFAQSVSFSEDDLRVVLADGRTIIVPLVWFHRLAGASLEQLENYELLGGGEGIHWPELDEDISVDGLLRGIH